jgi:integrase
VAAITAAEVSAWVGGLVDRGLAPTTATRALATLRSILAFAVADGRVHRNVAATVRRPASGRVRREGRALTLAELHALTAACAGPYRDVVPVLALAGQRWGELAGLRIGDRVSVPGPGLRLSRAVLASGGGGALYMDTLKNHRARTVPLVAELVPIIDRWAAGKEPEALAVRCARRRAAAGVELEAVGRLAGRYGGSRCARCARSRSAPYRGIAAAGRWRGPEGGPAGAGARHRRDDDGPVWASGGCQPVASRPADRGHLGHRRSVFERNPGQGRIRKNSKSWAFVVEPPWSRLGESNPRPTHYEKPGTPL